MSDSKVSKFISTVREGYIPQPEEKPRRGMDDTAPSHTHMAPGYAGVVSIGASVKEFEQAMKLLHKARENQANMILTNAALSRSVSQLTRPTPSPPPTGVATLKTNNKLYY